MQSMCQDTGCFLGASGIIDDGIVWAFVAIYLPPEHHNVFFILRQVDYRALYIIISEQLRTYIGGK